MGKTRSWEVTSVKWMTVNVRDYASCCLGAGPLEFLGNLELWLGVPIILPDTFIYFYSLHSQETYAACSQTLGPPGWQGCLEGKQPGFSGPGHEIAIQWIVVYGIRDSIAYICINCSLQNTFTIIFSLVFTTIPGSRFHPHLYRWEMWNCKRLGDSYNVTQQRAGPRVKARHLESPCDLLGRSYVH